MPAHIEPSEAGARALRERAADGPVLMLNLLIAIMGDAYSKVKESELVEGLHERAKMIVDSRARVATTNTFAVSSLALGICWSDRR